jgi:hypothetical protein
MVDIDLKSLYAQGLSANDVVNAVNAQSLIIPSGIAKIGPNEFVVRLMLLRQAMPGRCVPAWRPLVGLVGLLAFTLVPLRW